jgi:hypothetical protein
VRQSLSSFLLESLLQHPRKEIPCEKPQKSLKPSEKLENRYFVISPISGGTMPILLPYIVALKQNFQKSYPDAIPPQSQAFWRDRIANLKVIRACQ